MNVVPATRLLIRFIGKELIKHEALKITISFKLNLMAVINIFKNAIERIRKIIELPTNIQHFVQFLIKYGKKNIIIKIKNNRK